MVYTKQRVIDRKNKFVRYLVMVMTAGALAITLTATPIAYAAQDESLDSQAELSQEPAQALVLAEPEEIQSQSSEISPAPDETLVLADTGVDGDENAFVDDDPIVAVSVSAELPEGGPDDYMPPTSEVYLEGAPEVVADVEIVSKDGILYYQVDGAIERQSKDQLLKSGDEYYFVFKNGKVVSDAQRNITDGNSNGYVKAGTYSFDSEGKLVQIYGIYKKDSSNWYFLDSDWALVKDKVVSYMSKYYLTDYSGKIYRDCNRNVSEAAAAEGIVSGYYHINADGTMEASPKPTELREALNSNMHISADGKDNAVTIKVFYYGLPKEVTNIVVRVNDALTGSKAASKDVSITKGKDGNFTLTFSGLAPDTEYGFAFNPYYKPSSNTTVYPCYGYTKRYVKTTSKNNYKIYDDKAAVQKEVITQLAKGNSLGNFFVRITAGEYSDLSSSKTTLQKVFIEAITADSTEHLGSLLGLCLSYTITQNGVWQNDGKYYVGVNVTTTSTSTQINNYNKMVSWFNAAKKQAQSKSSDKEKYKVLAKYLMDRCSYDYDAYNNYNSSGNTSYHSWSQNSTGPVLHGQAVCSGYAATFKKMCVYAGLACEVVTSPDHAWNLVKVGSKWYHYDVTWNDCVGSQTQYAFMGSTEASWDIHSQAEMSSSFKSSHPIASTRLSW